MLRLLTRRHVLTTPVHMMAPAVRAMATKGKNALDRGRFPVPPDLTDPDYTFYTEDHDWVAYADKIATVGITQFAANALGDVTHVDLPEIGDELDQGDACAVIDSVKTASDLISPVTGVVRDINEDLVSDPSLLGTDPEGTGWVFKVEMSNKAELEALMNEKEYKEFCSKEDAH